MECFLSNNECVNCRLLRRRMVRRWIIYLFMVHFCESVIISDYRPGTSNEGPLLEW